MSNCSQELQAPLVLNHSTVWTPHLNIFFGPDRWFSHRPILMNNYYIQNPLLQVKSFGHKMHQCYNKCIQDSVNSMNGNPVERIVKGWLPSYNRRGVSGHLLLLSPCHAEVVVGPVFLCCYSSWVWGKEMGSTALLSCNIIPCPCSVRPGMVKASCYCYSWTVNHLSFYICRVVLH